MTVWRRPIPNQLAIPPESKTFCVTSNLAIFRQTWWVNSRVFRIFQAPLGIVQFLQIIFPSSVSAPRSTAAQKRRAIATTARHGYTASSSISETQIRSQCTAPTFFPPALKFIFSKNATKIDKILTLNLTFTK